MEKRLHLLAEKQELEKSDPVGNIERIQEINSEVAKIEDEFAEIEKKTMTDIMLHQKDKQN